MTDVNPSQLLAPFEGRRPAAPAWFDAALAQAPERRMLPVDGAPIEMLTWGERGLPGLLLLHGKMAHADWWSFIAPFFAATHRVAALSFAGMGGSGWRGAYSVESMAGEAMAVADAAGLFEGTQPPLVVAHSFGAFAALLCTQHHGERFGGLVTVDMPLLSREQREARPKRGVRGVITARPTRIYPSLEAALARFRFAPEQPCENLYLAEHIARGSLKQVPLEDGTGSGWTWRFDPRVADIHPGRPIASVQAMRCPLAVCWGAESVLVDAAVAAHVRSVVPPGTPEIEIPAARHHVMVDQPLAFVAALRGLFGAWPPRRSANMPLAAHA
jgi:pimeloyl-ACP methyl ester carboxylesterase